METYESCTEIILVFGPLMFLQWLLEADMKGKIFFVPRSTIIGASSAPCDEHLVLYLKLLVTVR